MVFFRLLQSGHEYVLKRLRHSARPGGRKPWPGLRLERLEDRTAPATAVWTGAGYDNFWSSAGNWQGNVVPSTGDDLVFPVASQLNIFNDLQPATPFRSLTITGSGYTFTGNGVLLSEGITARNTTGTNTIVFFLGLQKSQTFTLVAELSTLNLQGGIDIGGTSLTIAGRGALSLSGGLSGNLNASIVKQGVGRTTVSGNNVIYSGGFIVQEGELVAASGNALGDIAGVTQVASGASLGINAGATIPEPLRLSGKGFGGTGVINMIGGTAATLTGPIQIQGDMVIGVSSGQTLNVTGAITESGGQGFGLAKVGTGVLSLQNVGLFTGSTQVNGGTFQLINGGTILSSTITVNAGSTFDLNNSGSAFGNRVGPTTHIILNGSTLTFTGRSGSDVTQQFGTLTLASGANNVTTNSNVASGSFMLLQGAALERLPGATVNFNQGALTLGTLSNTNGNRIQFDSPLQVTPNAPVPNGTGILPFALVNGNEFATYGAGGNTQGIAAYSRAVLDGSPDYVTDLAVPPSSTPPLNVRVTTNQTIASNTTINSLIVSNSAAVTVTVNAGVTLTIASGALLTLSANQAVTFAGPGTIRFQSPEQGEMFLFASTGTAGTAFNLGVGGDLSITRGLTSSGSAPLTFGGSAANSYTGTTTVNAGSLILNKTGVLAIPGDLVVGDGAGTDSVTMNSPGQLPVGLNVRVNGGATLTLAGTNTLSALTLKGGSTASNNNAVLLTGTGQASLLGDLTVLAPDASSFLFAGQSLIAGTFVNNAFTQGSLSLGNQPRVFAVADGGAVNDLDVFASLSGANSSVGLTKTGDGTALLRGNSSLNGPMTFTAGSLVINGNQPLTPIQVPVGLTLWGGVGTTAGTVLQPNVFGTVSPGQMPGPNGLAGPPASATTNTIGTLMAQAGIRFFSSSKLVIEVAGYLVPGVDYDRLNVGGTLTIDPGATLILDMKGIASTSVAYGVITFGASIGQFGNVQLINNPNQFTATLLYGNGQVDIAIVATSVPAPQNLVVVGPNAGQPGTLQAFDALTRQKIYTVNAFADTRGVQVALGDVNGDRLPDIIVAQATGGRIRVFDGKTGQQFTTAIGQFTPFPGYKGRLFVASGYVNNDAFADIIIGSGPGRKPLVRVVSGQSPSKVLASFLAYPGGFRGGVRVAAGNLNGLPGDEIVTAPASRRTVDVRVFQANGARLAEFRAYDLPFKGGAYLAVGDLTGDSIADVVVGPGGPNTGLPVKVFSGTSLTGGPVTQFTPFPGYQGPVAVALTDVTGDGLLDLVAAQGPGGREVKLFNQTGVEIDSFFAYDPSFAAGMTVAGSHRI